MTEQPSDQQREIYEPPSLDERTKGQRWADQIRQNHGWLPKRGEKQ